MTHYAVLADVDRSENTPLQKEVLKIISDIGLSVSSASLAVSLVIILALKYVSVHLVIHFYQVY